MKANVIKVAKIFVVIGVLIVFSLILLQFFHSDVVLSDGNYVSTTNSLTSIKLDSEKNQFEFTYNPVLSYIPHGSFDVDGERLTATYTWQDYEEVYVFKIIDGETLEFVKDESTDIQLENGTVFKATK